MDEEPKPNEATLIRPDAKTQREVLQLYEQVDRLTRMRGDQVPPTANAVQPQDRDSGLVHREWIRRSRRRGEVVERTLEGEAVKAEWIDRDGQVRRAAGKVTRNAAGELVVESWSEKVRQETEVPRDSSVSRDDDTCRPRRW